jgi:hypothetical protein
MRLDDEDREPWRNAYQNAWVVGDLIALPITSAGGDGL